MAATRAHGVSGPPGSTCFAPLEFRRASCLGVLLVVGVVLLVATRGYAEEVPLVGPYLLDPQPNSMIVQWESGGKRAGQVVFEGPEGRVRKVSGQFRPAGTLTKDVPGRMARAKLSGLRACTRYRYRVEPLETKSWPHSFRTPSPPGELCPDGMRIALFGDTRSKHEDHAAVVRQLEAEEPHLVVNVGDIVSVASRVNEWKKFFDIERKMLGNTPMVLVPGNHEGYLAKDFGRAMLSRFFALPDQSAAGHRRFDYGIIRFITLDVYWGKSLARGDEGWKWLEKELSDIPPNRYGIVVVHTPVYSFGRHGVYENMKDLRLLLSRYNVAAVAAGHHHGYEHFLVGKTHHVTLGGGGAPFHDPHMKPVPGEENLLVSEGQFHHYLILDVTADRLLFRVRNTDTGSTHEEWELKR